jgi:hypothetical protein
MRIIVTDRDGWDIVASHTRCHFYFALTQGRNSFAIINVFAYYIRNNVSLHTK